MGVTSVTRTWPPRTQAEADPASTWTVAKEFDFTGMSNYTFGANDTEALDSVDWVSRNQANSTTFAIVNGTGLKMSIENDKTSSTW